MWRRVLAAVLGLVAFSAQARTVHGPLLAPGDSQHTIALNGVPIEVFVHLPSGCTPRLVLIVFHGVQRDAGPYREHARALADPVCAAIVAPAFDRARFPRDLYQYGGVGPGGMPQGQRSIDMVQPLIDWAQQMTDAEPVLVGHSAGSQFLDRVAAYAPLNVRMLIANPSTWVLPTQDAAPFGFGGVPGAEAAMRAYLALPITVLLGGSDTGTHNLAISPEAMAQGPNRLTRGHGTFEKAEAVAKAHGWAFGWTLAVVPGVGHDATRMFGSNQAAAALPR